MEPKAQPKWAVFLRDWVVSALIYRPFFCLMEAFLHEHYVWRKGLTEAVFISFGLCVLRLYWRFKEQKQTKTEA